MVAHGSGSPHDARLLDTLKRDVRHVTTAVRERGVEATVRGTFADLEAFYLSPDARQRLARMGVVKRWALRLWWLLKSLLLKLTPARRVLLAIALVLMAAGVRGVQVGPGPDAQVNANLPILGLLLLLLILMLELKDKLVARDELEAGRKVQLALMPERSPKIPGWDVWLYTQPANDVGGDLVDYLRVDSNRFGVGLGDVAGKALPAALLMAKLQSTLRALVPYFGGLSELGAAVNRILCRDGLPNRFATLVYLELIGGEGRVRLLNAGHMPPLVVRRDSIEDLPRGSVALGILDEAVFAEQRVELAERDILVVYSDGVTEAMNTAGEFFGDERLRAVVRQHASGPAEAMGLGVIAAVDAFVGGARRHDDVSIVVLRRAS